jgi:hypothetical protein
VCVGVTGLRGVLYIGGGPGGAGGRFGDWGGGGGYELVRS